MLLYLLQEGEEREEEPIHTGKRQHNTLSIYNRNNKKIIPTKEKLHLNP